MGRNGKNRSVGARHAVPPRRNGEGPHRGTIPALKREIKRETLTGALKRFFPRMNAGAPTSNTMLAHYGGSGVLRSGRRMLCSRWTMAEASGVTSVESTATYRATDESRAPRLGPNIAKEP